MQIIERIEQETKTAQDIFTKLLKRYAALDKDSNFLPLDGKKNTFQIPEKNREDFRVAQEEFQMVAFAVDAQPIKLEDLDGMRLTPVEIKAIRCLLGA